MKEKPSRAVLALAGLASLDFSQAPRPAGKPCARRDLCFSVNFLAPVWRQDCGGAGASRRFRLGKAWGIAFFAGHSFSPARTGRVLAAVTPGFRASALFSEGGSDSFLEILLGLGGSAGGCRQHNEEPVCPRGCGGDA